MTQHDREPTRRIVTDAVAAELRAQYANPIGASFIASAVAIQALLDTREEDILTMNIATRFIEDGLYAEARRALLDRVTRLRGEA